MPRPSTSDRRVREGQTMGRETGAHDPAAYAESIRTGMLSQARSVLLWCRLVGPASSSPATRRASAVSSASASSRATCCPTDWWMPKPTCPEGPRPRSKASGSAQRQLRLGAQPPPLVRVARDGVEDRGQPVHRGVDTGGEQRADDERRLLGGDVPRGRPPPRCRHRLDLRYSSSGLVLLTPATVSPGRSPARPAARRPRCRAPAAAGRAAPVPGGRRPVCRPRSWSPPGPPG